MAKARRAKKSKMPKKLLLVPVALMGIGVTVATLNTNTTISKTIGSTQVEVQDASNFVKDIFTEESTRYLPIVYTDPYEKITRDDLDREFRYAGMPIKSISTDTIGTGTIIETENATYTLLIYGDVDGNGEVNVRDVQVIVKHLLYGNGFELKGLNRIAANVDNEKNDVINVRDAQRIVQFLIGKKSIIDSIPTSDLIKDKEAPVITLNGEKEVTIKVGEKYEDAGATVIDNLDPNVKVAVDTSRVNTSVPGTYDVIYTANDASGNQAQIVTRTVKVVDYVSDINIAIYPTQEYVVGQTVTLKNMVAYPVYKYAGEVKEAIDISKITTTPTVITEDMVGTSSITLKYEDVTKTIVINVTEDKPVIQLEKYDGKLDVTLKVYKDTYEEETNLKAYDELEDKYYDVEITGDTVDTTTIGTYKVIYTSAKNEVGNFDQKTRTVNVVDWAQNVTFGGLESITDKIYVVGDRIDLSGITVKANYRVGGEKDVTNEIKVTSNVTTAAYGTNKITISCEIAGETFSEEIDIKVVKQFETVRFVDQATGEAITASTMSADGEIYERIKVATITQGKDEKPINKDYLNVAITNSDIDGFKNAPICETELNSDGNIDIYFTGVNIRNNEENNTPYVITVKTKSSNTNTLRIEVSTTVDETISNVDMIFKTQSGEIVETESGGRIKFKEGESILAELIFSHEYDYNGQKCLVEIPEIPQSRLSNINISGKGYTSSQISTGTITTNENDRLEVLINSVANVHTGADKRELELSFTIDGMRIISEKLHIYPTSQYNVVVDNIASSTSDIPLDLNNAIGTNGTVKDISANVKASDGSNLGTLPGKAVVLNGTYYTIAKISISDQYGGTRPVTRGDILSNNKKVQFNLLSSGDISIIGLNESGSKYEEVTLNTDTIEYIGIALATDDVDRINGQELSVTFDSKTATIGNIWIKKKATSTVETVQTLVQSGTYYFYENINMVKVKAGVREEEFTDGTNGTENTVNNIECIVTRRDGANYSTVPANEYTITKSYDALTHNVTISFKTTSKVTGTYYITPKYKGENVEPYYGEGTRKENSRTAIPVILAEDTSVSRIEFVDDNGNSVGSRTFGEVPTGDMETRKIKFIHDYGNGDERIIKTIDNDRINIQTADTDKISNIWRVSTDGTALGSTTVSTKPIEKIRVETEAIENLNSSNNTAMFTISIDNPIIYLSTGQEAKDYEPTSFTVTLIKPVIHHLSVGNSNSVTDENIRLYRKSEAASAKANGAQIYQETPTSLCYTVIPISFVTEKFGKVNSKYLTANRISTNKADIGVKDKFVFIDNIHAGNNENLNGASSISVIGLTKVDGEYQKLNNTDSSTQIKYIGIATTDEENLETTNPYYPDLGEEADELWEKLTRFTVYFNGASDTTTYPELTGITTTRKTFTVNP